MSLGPTMLRRMLDHRTAAADPAAVLHHLRLVQYGAAPMPLALLEEANRDLGVEFTQGYGMTECSGNVVFLTPEDHRRGFSTQPALLRAAGRPGPGVELEIRNARGQPQPADPAVDRLPPRPIG